MVISKSSAANRFIKKSIYVLLIVITALALLLILVLAWGVPIVLKNNDIGFSEYSFNFPNKIKLENFSYQTSQLSLNGKEFSLAWSWRKLVKGQLNVSAARIKDLDLLYLEESEEELHETPSNTLNDEFSLPHFQVLNLQVENALVNYINLADTNTFHLQTLHVNELIAADKIWLDTLLLSSENRYIYRESKIPKNDTSTLQGLDFIPPFEINHLSIFNSGFQLENADQNHTFSEINLQLSGVKNNDWFDLKLHDFRFNYQDTLAINLMLDNAKMQNNLNTNVAELNFALPGFQLNLTNTSFINQPANTLETTLQKSYLATSWLKFFLPDYEEYMPKSKIFIDGNLQYHDGQVSLNNLVLSTLKNTSLTFSGNIGLADDKIIIDVVSELNSSTADIKQFYHDFDYDVLAFKNANLKLQTKGKLDSLALNGQLKLDNNLFNYSANIKNDENYFSYAANLMAADLWINQVTSTAPDSSFIGDLKLQVNGKSSSIPGFKLQSGNVSIGNYKIDQVMANYKSMDYGADSLMIDLIQQNSTLSLVGAYQENTLPQFSFQGKMNVWFNPLLNPEKSPVQFSTGLVGFASWEDFSYAGSLNLRNALLNNRDSVYNINPVAVNIELNENILKANVTENELPVIELKADLDIPAFTLDSLYNKNIARYLPLAEVKGAYEMNEQLFQWITGVPGTFHLNNFLFRNDQQLAVADIDIPSISLGENQMDDIQLSFEISENIRSRLTTNQLDFAGIQVNNLQLQLEKAKNNYQLLCNFTTSEKQYPFSLALQAKSARDTFELSFIKDNPLTLAGIEWQVNPTNSIAFSRDLNSLQGGVELFNGSEMIKFSSLQNIVQVEIDSLNLVPVLALVKPDSLPMGGNLNFKVNYDKLKNNLAAKGEIYNLSIDSLQLQPILFEASKAEEVLTAQLNMGEKLEASLNYDQALNFSLLLDRFELGSFNQLPLIKDYWQSKGNLSVDFSGSYDKQLTFNGIAYFDNAEINVPGYLKQIRLSEDTLTFNQDRIQFQDFTLSNSNNDYLYLSGNAYFDPLAYDITAKSDRFSVTDILDYTPVDGNLAIACDLKLTSNNRQTKYDGTLEVLPDAYFEYTYSGTYSFENASETVQFIKFDELDEQTEKQISKGKTDPINWNIDLKINNATFYLIYNSVSQEFISITGAGNLDLRNGPSQLPYLYGSFVSTQGEAFYVPPMIPELNLELERTEIAWNGELYQPVITLEGVKSVKAPTKGLGNRFDKRSSVAPFDIKVLVDEKKMQDLDLVFDLESSDSEIQPYLQSLHPDTRQAYAINLLLFGTFELEFAEGGSAYMNFLASKLNEISRRNLKNASLSFSIDDTSIDPNDDENKLNRLNYSFSKGFLDNKLQVTVGGNIILSDKAVSNSDLATPLGSIEFNYILNEQPYWGLRGEKSTAYEGIIDGNVAKTSLGLKFQKSYPTFWHFLKIGKDKSKQ